MREQLREINNVRALFRATVRGYGSRTSHGHLKPMVLLQDVRDRHGRVLTDHVWFDRTKWTEALEPGDEIEFEARVRPYWKGYIDQHLDYKLTHPTKLRKLGTAAMAAPFPLFAIAGIH